MSEIDKNISKRAFGSLPDGRQVEAWTLIGKGGLEMEVITLGGIVRKLMVPDQNGKLDDIVLGFDDLESYLGPHPFFGATVGRVAGRISGGQFELDGKQYSLEINDPPNHLHGGSRALDKQLWEATVANRDDGNPSINLFYKSPEGEQGYPGNIDIKVTYTITEDNEFIFETEVKSDRRTPVSLTHHSYFNLSGKGNVLDHQIKILSDQAFLTDEKMTLLDKLQSVEKQANDFRTPKRLGDQIHGIWQEHGDLYWLGSGNSLQKVAYAYDPKSGRKLIVKTTNSCLQTYFGPSFDGRIKGKGGDGYYQYAGLCFECEGYPNGANGTKIDDIFVTPELPQIHRTTYQFTA